MTGEGNVSNATVTIRPGTESDLAELSALILRTIRISNARDYAPAEIEGVCAGFEAEPLKTKLRQRESFVAVAGQTSLASACSLEIGFTHCLSILRASDGESA